MCACVMVVMWWWWRCECVRVMVVCVRCVCCTCVVCCVLEKKHAVARQCKRKNNGDGATYLPKKPRPNHNPAGKTAQRLAKKPRPNHNPAGEMAQRLAKETTKKPQYLAIQIRDLLEQQLGTFHTFDGLHLLLHSRRKELEKQRK